jgi:hypothetical protein
MQAVEAASVTKGDSLDGEKNGEEAFAVPVSL